MAEIETVTTCFTDNKEEKEIYYNVRSLKEAAWLFLQDHLREGEHKILVEEKTKYNPITYTYKTSELKDYKRESQPKPDKPWYYNREDEKVEGPIFKEELIEKIQNKSIPKDALVWEKGMDDWQQVNQVPEFEEHFNKNTPPPLSKSKQKNNIEVSSPDKPETSRRVKRSKEPETKEQKSTNEKPEQTHRWLKFYLYIKTPLMVLSIFLSIIIASSFLQSNGMYVFLLVMLPIMSVMSAYVFLGVGLYKRKLWAWKFNWVFIFLEPILGGFGQANEPGETVIFISLGLIIYSLPNYIYFKKRKHLFKN